MRHFVAYHNTAKMGYAYAPTGALQTVLSNKPVRQLLGSQVWVITYEETDGARHYVIAGVFEVSDTGDTREAGFSHYVAGKGRVFRPSLRIDSHELISALLQATGNFAFGLQEVNNRVVIGQLEDLVGGTARAAKQS